MDWESLQPQRKKSTAVHHSAQVEQPAHTVQVAAQAGAHPIQIADIQATDTATTLVIAHTAHTTGPKEARAELEASAAREASGHKARGIGTTYMSMIETLTKKEITDIIRDLGYQAIPKDDEEFGELIFSSNEGVRWNVYLGTFGPFFEEILITLFSWTKSNPLLFLNKWNSESFFAASTPCTDDTNQPEPEPDGTFRVTFETRINFEGGVSIDHIRNRINEWVYAVTRIAKLDKFIFLDPASINEISK